MYVTNGKFVAENRDRPPLAAYIGAALRGKFEEGGASDLFGFTDATSNSKCAVGACARIGGAFTIPIATGPATTSIPALVSSNFLPAFNLTTVRFDIISSIRLLRFAPLTPATHTSGDLR